MYEASLQPLALICVLRAGSAWPATQQQQLDSAVETPLQPRFVIAVKTD
jgi:hypothetical protein